MSNPGVVTLAAIKHFPYRFEVEDNIGEAIHIHYKDIRLDLTINELVRLARDMEGAFNEIIDVEGFSCRDFDPVNLSEMAGILPDLESISYENVMLEDLLIDTFDELGEPVIRPLKESRVYKALKGDKAENNAHKQTNLFKSSGAEPQTNRERLEYNLEQIREKGYPVGKEFIILFDDDYIIRDGQHRAACLYFLYGNISVPIRRLHFKKNSPEVINNEEPAVVGTIYIDTGSGFSDDEIIIVRSSKIRLGQRFDLPEHTKAIRFDPVEGVNCMVCDLEVSCERGPLPYVNANGFDFSDIHVFDTEDPQFFIDFNGEPTDWVEIQAVITPGIDKKIFRLINQYNDSLLKSRQMAAELDEENMRLTEISAELDEENIQLAEISAELNEKNTQLKEAAVQLEEKDAQLKETAEELDEKKIRLEEAADAIEKSNAKQMELTAELDDVKTKLAEIESAYFTVLHSACWKVTGPVRKMLDMIKKHP